MRDETVHSLCTGLLVTNEHVTCTGVINLSLLNSVSPWEFYCSPETQLIWVGIIQFSIDYVYALNGKGSIGGSVMGAV